MYDTVQLQIQILSIGFIKGGDSETVLLETFRFFLTSFIPSNISFTS